MSLPSLSKAEDAVQGRANLASLLKVSYSTVGMWHARGSIPSEWLGEIERVTRRQVTVYDLLSDISAAKQAKTTA